MKIISIFCALFMLLWNTCYAGGNTSLANISKVHSVIIEDEKVIITVSGVLEYWAVATEEINSNYFIQGEKAIPQKFKMSKTVIEVIPYFSNPQIIFGSEPSESMKESGIETWHKQLHVYQDVKKGDKINIRFQGELVTLTQGKVAKIIGYGNLERKDN